MAELVREIVAEDLPIVRALLEKVFADGMYEDIVRLGGMTNRSYKVTRADGKEYLVRIPGEGTEKIIDRREERKSTELGCRLGIDSELLYFGDDGMKVMRFIENPLPMSEEVMRRKENIAQAAAVFRRLHTCGEDTGVRFEVFEMAEMYEKIIQENGVALYDDYEEIRQAIMEIKTAADAFGPASKVPCHNDSLIGNWVLDAKGRLYLIDWEYAGMNEPMWDLSCLSIEIGYTEENEEELLEAYYGREGKPDEKKRFFASKLYVDYLWTLWGLTRVPFDGIFMQEYADARYMRLKRNLGAYRGL
ncbi:MAG: phosphotransferase [Lachnospiraceae bacterium]|nr:phosphotransferase [Lachnospiraceae bacterium]